MEELRIKQKQEAIERMKMLKIYSQAIKEFEKENVINVSEYGGILFWLDDEQQEMVKRFEEKYNAVVYHVIHNYTEFGELYSLLYVSQHENEWDYDKTIKIINESAEMTKNLYDRLYYRNVNKLLTTWEFFGIHDVYRRLQESVNIIAEITSKMLSERENIASFNFKIKVKAFEEEISKIVRVIIEINPILFKIDIDPDKIEALK